MRWLGSILLIGVFVRHDTSQWLPGYSPQAWFYILGGIWEMMVCLSILLLAKQSQQLLIAAMWIGILEGAQVSTCRLLTADITKVPKGQNLCDALTGFPIGFLLTVVEFGIVCWAIKRSWRSASRL